MNCNIIKDLLPSYIDGICSEDTAKFVEEHIQHCEECKMCVNRMQQQTAYVQQKPEEVEKAITPFKKINKKRRIQVITAIVMTFLMTFFITTVGYLIYQDVGVVHDFFSPKVTAIVDRTDDTGEWQSIHFSDSHFNDQDYLIYDSLFWKKEIINSVYNSSDILLRVKDEKGNIVIDEFKVLLGKSVKLNSLKRNEKYYFEIKAPHGRLFINAI